MNFYHYGDKFRVSSDDFFIDGVELLLVQVASHYACLVSLETGNRIRDPIEVRDTVEISEVELEEMLEGYCSLFELRKIACGKEAFRQMMNRFYGII